MKKFWIPESIVIVVVLTAVMFFCGTVRAEEKTLIGFGYVGPVSDQGFTWTHDQGRLFVEEKLGEKVETTMVESLPYSNETSRILSQFAEDGAKMIVINSQYGDFVKNVADKYPEVAFMELHGGQRTDNLISFYHNDFSPTYLIGMMAALLSKTGKLGYVASFPIDSVYTSVNSFTMGARAVDPNATCKVVLINSWFDPTKAKQAAEALISDGCDFLFGYMDEPAYLQVAEEEGIWAAMATGTDVRHFGPNAYVSGIILDWRQFYLDEVKKVLDGTWKGNRIVHLPMGKGVDRDSWGKNVPEVYQWMVEAVRDHMIEGWTPFVGPIKDKNGQVKIPAGETLTERYFYDKWLWSVEGVIGMPN